MSGRKVIAGLKEAVRYTRDKNMELRVQRDDAYGDREFYIIQELPGMKRWWTASWQGDGWYLMTGNQNRVVQEDGALGRKLIKAINDYKASHRSHTERSKLEGTE